MPLDELGEFAVRAIFDLTVETVSAVGDGQSRLAAVVRLLVWSAIASGCAAGLWWLMPDALAGSGGAIGVSVLAAGLGGVATWFIGRDVRLLRHWGEPLISADGKGLVFPGGRHIAWQAITALVLYSRGRKRGVRVDTTKGEPVFVASRAPQTLLATLEAELAYHGRHLEPPPPGAQRGK